MNTSFINLYHKYHLENRLPFLLESLGPRTSIATLSVLGVDPKRKLLCKNGILFENGIPIGDALEIFQHLRVKESSEFFPAWIGYFGYEFAQNLGHPTKPGSDGFPEAVFYYYETGHTTNTNDESNPEVAELLKPLLAKADKEDFFFDAYRSVEENIRNGNVYQVNIARKYTFDAQYANFTDIYLRLRKNNPSPFMALIQDDDWAIASASPERLFSIKNGRISSRPIAGTRPRHIDPIEDLRFETELLVSPKERAEHAMLVDLVRNDLTKVCTLGSVHVDEAFIVERYSHVMHLVSEVRGEVCASLQDVFSALFPAGTITGTPKESAMTQIRDLEPFTRGPYTGSLGYVSGVGVDFNILIRSAFRSGVVGHIYAGAGIVAKSEAPLERGEVDIKAKSVSVALKHDAATTKPDLPKPGQRFLRPVCSHGHQGRVLFIENHDSFSHNIVDLVRRLGCSVDIIDHDQNIDPAQYRRVIFGPGPKNPKQAGQLMPTLARAIESNCAILGICLGHQALGLHFGAQIEKAHQAIHGELDIIEHKGHPLFAGIPSKFMGMRYHSLVLKHIPQTLEVIAISSTNEVMAISHKERPWYGVQFHPESFLSEFGDRLLSNFLHAAMLQQ